MCGRFTQHYTWAEVHAFLSVFGELDTPRNLQPRYNIAPTTFIDVVTSRMQGRDIVGREMVPMRWGLVPSWWKKSRKDVPATFNARAETVAEKPMFRGAYRSRRCVVPASGFYEWTGKKGDKQPPSLSMRKAAPILALAGLYESWRDPHTQDEILSCTLIVTEATQWMMLYHDRMPVLLQ